MSSVVLFPLRMIPMVVAVVVVIAVIPFKRPMCVVSRVANSCAKRETKAKSLGFNTTVSKLQTRDPLGTIGDPTEDLLGTTKDMTEDLLGTIGYLTEDPTKDLIRDP